MSAELEAALTARIRPAGGGGLVGDPTGTPLLAGVVLVADDFDLLDPLSRSVAAYALRRIAQGGCCVLLSVDSAAVTPELDRLPVVELAGLDLDHVRRRWRTTSRRRSPIASRLSWPDTPAAIRWRSPAWPRRSAPKQVAGRDLLPHPLPLGRPLCTRAGRGQPPRRGGATARGAGTARPTRPRSGGSSPGRRGPDHRAGLGGLVHQRGDLIAAAPLPPLLPPPPPPPPPSPPQ